MSPGDTGGLICGFNFAYPSDTTYSYKLYFWIMNSGTTTTNTVGIVGCTNPPCNVAAGFPNTGLIGTTTAVASAKRQIESITIQKSATANSLSATYGAGTVIIF